MIRGIKKSKLLTLVISLCSVLICSAIGFFVGFNNQEIAVDAAYTFSDSGSNYFESTNDSNYKNNVEFYVGSPKAFWNFASSVAYGCNFSGKYVYLTNDINCSGWTSMAPIGCYIDTDGVMRGFKGFSGVFDGQGYAIKNLSTSVTDRPGLATEINLGLFSILEDGARVYNVKVENSTHTFESFGLGLLTISIMCGGIAGKSDGNVIINNCYVKNFNVVNHNTDSKAIISSSFLVPHCTSRSVDPDNPSGAKTLTVTNVLCDGFSRSGAGSIHFFAHTPGYSWAHYTGFKTSDSTAYWKFSQIIYRNCSSYIILNSVNSVQYTYGEANKTEGLDCGSNGGTSGTIWYQTSDYNDGYPCLRQFMTWKTVNFDVQSSVLGSVSPQSIEIPSDATMTKPTLQSFTVYGQYVRVRPASGYLFSHWSYDGSAYIAHFTKGYYMYEFESLKFNGKTIDPVIKDSLGRTVSQPIQIGIGAITSVKCEYTATQTIIKYLVGNYEVSYAIDEPKYTLHQCGSYSFYIWDDDTEETDVFIEDIHDYHSEYWFVYTHTFTFTAPTLKLKIYNSEFV